MTSEEIKIANMLKKLDELKDACLQLHPDSIIYQVCELIQDLINEFIVKK